MTGPRLLHGDCRHTLTRIPDNTIGALITDPPYGLSKEPDMAEVLGHWLAGDDYTATGGGFMGKTWDSFVPGPATWRQVFRVMKPGAYGAVFAGSRTVDLMGVALRLAGFEVRDTLHWTYGSGFPKSLDVSKAIDKAAGAVGELVGERRFGTTSTGQGAGWNTNNVAATGRQDVYAPATDEARTWEGWGTALKPSHEPILLIRKPLGSTVAACVLEHGTGAINIDGTRVGSASTVRSNCADMGYHGGLAAAGSAYVTGSGSGRWPANTLLTHSPDCEQTGEQPGNLTVNTGFSDTPQADGWGTKRPTTTTVPTVEPLFRCAPGCPVTELNGQAGQTAARFFPTFEWDPVADVAPFRYVSKPSKKERNAGLDHLPNGSTHPTVKPVALLRWLVTLITPPGETILDPYLGSGTTAVAATLEDRNWVGCELTDEYLPIIRGRVEWAEQQALEEVQLTLLDAA